MAYYRIADLVVKMEPRHSLTRDRARRYRTDEAVADMTVTGDGDAYEEHAALARSFYEQLLAFDGFLLHASAVSVDGKAYAFSAPSGTGKSTHASFWRALFGAEVINDDKPAIRLFNGTFYACGTPFSGKHDISAPVCVPLGGIAMLRRGNDNSVRRLSLKEALWSLLNQTHRPEGEEAYRQLLKLMDRLLATVPVYEVVCTCDPAAAEVAAEAMRNGV